MNQIVRHDILNRLLMKTRDIEVLRNEIKRFSMDFKYNCYCVAILNYKETYEYNDSDINQKMNEFILNHVEQVDSIILDDKLVLIGKGYTYHDFLAKLMVNNERVKKYFKKNYFITVGHNVACLEDLYFSYEAAKYLSEYEFIFREKEVISIDILRIKTDNEEENFPQILCSLIEIGDVDSMSVVIKKMKDYSKAMLMKELDSKIFMIQNSVLLHGLILRKYIERDEIPNLSLLVEGIMKAESIDDLFDLVLDFCIDCVVCLDSSTKDNVVLRMISYMEKNYDQDLKLVNIAKLFNYNSAYLGKIFKKETKESFNNVLDSIRINNAKKLIIQSDMKVYQISEQVGYSNIDYFYLKFKRNVGYSPKEYKVKNIQMVY